MTFCVGQLRKRRTRVRALPLPQKNGAPAPALDWCAELYAEACPDEEGQARTHASAQTHAHTECGLTRRVHRQKLNYEQFVRIFHLHVDHYSTQLCKVFDSDNSGKIGFRECVAQERTAAMLTTADYLRASSQVRVQPEQVQ